MNTRASLAQAALDFMAHGTDNVDCAGEYEGL